MCVCMCVYRRRERLLVVAHVYVHAHVCVRMCVYRRRERLLVVARVGLGFGPHVVRGVAAGLGSHVRAAPRRSTQLRSRLRGVHARAVVLGNVQVCPQRHMHMYMSMCMYIPGQCTSLPMPWRGHSLCPCACVCPCAYLGNVQVCPCLGEGIVYMHIYMYMYVYMSMCIPGQCTSLPMPWRGHSVARGRPRILSSRRQPAACSR